MSSTAGFADARPGLEEGHLPTGKAAVVDEFVTERTAGPAAGKERLVAVKTFLADFALSGFNPQQHRLPITGRFTNTHR